jgi:hypothetical protein
MSVSGISLKSVMEALQNNISNNVTSNCFIGWFQSGISIPQVTIWHIGSDELVAGVGDYLSSTLKGRIKVDRFQIDIYASGSAERERLYDDLYRGFLDEAVSLRNSGILEIREVESLDAPFSEEEPLRYFRKTIRIDVTRQTIASGF